MIKLRRLPLGRPLATKTTARANELRRLLAEGADIPDSLLNGYRDRELKAHLVAESHGKCIYCESRITHVYFGDVEHIVPKSTAPERRLDIDNLGLACAVCNNAKGESWDDVVPLVNPYVDDPANELLAFGCLLMRRPDRLRARLTIHQLQLNRPELVERRKERIDLLQPLADQYVQSPDGAVRALLHAELCRQAQDDSEYALVVRTYLEAVCQLRCDTLAPVIQSLTEDAIEDDVSIPASSDTLPSTPATSPPPDTAPRTAPSSTPAPPSR